jgi:hypothetical protein
MSPDFWLTKAICTESDSLGRWLNSASLSGFQVTETTMEHHNHSPESARPNHRKFLLTTGSTVAAV